MVVWNIFFEMDTVFKTYVRFKIEYKYTAWVGASRKILKLLDKIQIRAIILIRDHNILWSLYSLEHRCKFFTLFLVNEHCSPELLIMFLEVSHCLIVPICLCITRVLIILRYWYNTFFLNLLRALKFIRHLLDLSVAIDHTSSHSVVKGFLHLEELVRFIVEKTILLFKVKELWTTAPTK